MTKNKYVQLHSTLPSPLKPRSQIHRYEPRLFIHEAFAAHLNNVSLWHSLMSTKKKTDAITSRRHGVVINGRGAVSKKISAFTNFKCVNIITMEESGKNLSHFRSFKCVKFDKFYFRKCVSIFRVHNTFLKKNPRLFPGFPAHIFGKSYFCAE